MRPVRDVKEQHLCAHCKAVIPIDTGIAEKLAELSAGAPGTLVCQRCAHSLGLSGELYGVYAGDLYQRFNSFWLRLWPVGTFHV